MSNRCRGSRRIWFLVVSAAMLAFGCGRSSSYYRDEGRRMDNALDQVRKDVALLRVPAKAGESTAMTGAAGETGQPPIKQRVEAEASLDDLLRLTLAHSPLIQAARERWLAATQKSTQAASLPDPMVNFRYYVQSVETRTGPQKWSVGLSQRIPYPGKLIIAARAAERKADAGYLRYEAAIRDQIASAKEIYFELYYIDRAQEITENVEKLYNRYVALAAGGKEVGQTKLPETFRAESQRAQLGYDIVLLKEMRTAEEERLRATAGLTGDAGIGPTAEVAGPVPLAQKVEDLQAIAEKHNQELLAAGVEVAHAEDQVKLAHRAPIPDLVIGADYIKTGQPIRMLRNTDDGGKDPIVVGAGLSIPLWFPKYSAMAREAKALEEAAKAEQRATGLKIRADLARAYFSLSNASRLVRLYRDTLLPQARQAQQSAEELYRKGDANLASVLETTATWHNFELAHLRAVADYYQNVARLERILGTSFRFLPEADTDEPKDVKETQALPAEERRP